MSDTVVKRPGNVTLVIVFTWIVAISNLLAAAYLLIGSFRAAFDWDLDLSGSQLLITGIIALLLGLLAVSVALGLARGLNVARAIVISLMVIEIVAAVWVLIFYPPILLGPALWHIVWALLVIALLTTRRASEFFGTR